MQIVCPYCANVSEPVWVHGHGQCAHCKINIDECCRGETLQPTCPLSTQEFSR